MGSAVLAVTGAMIGLAVVAVLVGTKAQTPQVISSAGSALARVIGAAVSPVANTQNLFGGVGQSIGGISI